MKSIFSGLVLAAGLLSQLSFAADHPCKPKGEAQHTARVAVHECLESWAKAKDTAPSEDCSAKLSAFIQAAKDRIACHAEHKKK